MSLTVKVAKRLDNFNLDASFQSDGGVTALFGPSGSGKTSLIRMVAGLARPDSGRLVVDDQVVVDTDKGIFLPVHKRRFGYVFQEGRLLPHLSVRQNLLYGHWFAPKQSRATACGGVVDMLGIGHLLDRRPANLSGGEKQRVAIGRALLSSPRMLLMDEPLAALDEQRKAEILPYLERLCREAAMPILYVSHSVAEVARLADRVVMMSGGSVSASGSPSDVLGGVSSSLDGRDAGVVLDGTVIGLDAVHTLARIGLSASEIIIPNATVPIGAKVRVHIPERDVIVAIERPKGLSALNILECRIAEMDTVSGGMIRVRMMTGHDQIYARVTAFSAARLQLHPGMDAFAVIKTAALQI